MESLEFLRDDPETAPQSGVREIETTLRGPRQRIPLPIIPRPRLKKPTINYTANVLDPGAENRIGQTARQRRPLAKVRRCRREYDTPNRVDWQKWNAMPLE